MRVNRKNIHIENKEPANVEYRVNRSSLNRSDRFNTGGGVGNNNIFLLNDADRIKYIHNLIINDSHFSDSKLNFKKFAEYINVAIKNCLIHDKKNPIITKFGEAIYFEPLQRYINEDGFNKAHIKYATHFISGYVDNAAKKDIRAFDKSKFDAMQILIPSLLSPDVVRLYQKKDKKRKRKEAIIYAKEIVIDNVRCIVLVTEITKEGEVRSVTFFPKNKCGFIEKQKASGDWSDASITRLIEKDTPHDETQTMSTGGSMSHSSNTKDHTIIVTNTGKIATKYQIIDNQIVVNNEIITVDELYSYIKSNYQYSEGGSVSDMTEKDFLDRYFGANVYSKEIVDRFEIKSKSIGDDDKAKAYVEELQKEGFTVKKKSYSDFTAIKGVKVKHSLAKGGVMISSDWGNDGS